VVGDLLEQVAELDGDPAAASLRVRPSDDEVTGNSTSRPRARRRLMAERATMGLTVEPGSKVGRVERL